MPIYVYELDIDDETPVRFEFFQKMSDPPLKRHPETGQPIRRVLTAPNLAAKGSVTRPTKDMLSDKNLDRLGFTKYVKSDRGGYEKAAGKGPDLLNPNG